MFDGSRPSPALESGRPAPLASSNDRALRSADRARGILTSAHEPPHGPGQISRVAWV